MQRDRFVLTSRPALTAGAPECVAHQSKGYINNAVQYKSIKFLNLKSRLQTDCQGQ